MMIPFTTYYDYRGDPMIDKVEQVSSVADCLAERGDWLKAVLCTVRFWKNLPALKDELKKAG